MDSLYNFLNTLLPVKSLYQPDSNTLSAYLVLIIVVFFIVYWRKLVNAAKSLRHKLESLSKDFSENDLKENTLLEQIWNEYQETFIQFNDIKKTDKLAYSFFNETNLLSAKINSKLINSIPSLLVGIGILGTFVGLTFGISNFQTNSTEEIKVSIETLLSGMGTAFVSSIHGMFWSLVFTLIEKHQVNSLHKSIHDLCYILDNKYKLSKEDEIHIELENHKKTFKEYFIHKDDNGNDVKPANVFRDLFAESQKQSKALQSFSTELANLIEAGFEKILNDPNKGVLFELQSLKGEIEKLGSKLQDPATEMTQNVVKELESSMSKMIEEFKVSISGSTKSELENLTTLLGQAGNSLNDFPNKLELMTDNLNQNFEGLQEVVQQIAKQTLQQSEESTAQMRKQVDMMSEKLKNQIGDLQVGQEVLINKQSENLEVSERLLNSFNSSIEQLNELTSQVNNTISSFNKVQEELNSASTQLKSITDNVLNSSKSFKEAQLKFNQHSNEFLSQNRATIDEIQLSLDIAKEVSSDYSAKFEVIEKGLQNIFQEISTGLEDYRNTVGESLGSFLGKYTEALTNTAKSLSGAATKQEDILEELTDQLSKLRKRGV